MKSRVALGVVAVFAGLLASCAGSGNDDLDQSLCDAETAGAGFQELTRGDFSPRDLADLGDRAGERERAFRHAGMQGGRFVLFKQSLPRPPFDPPVNLVCQVIEFGSAEEAGAWVGELRPDAILDGVIMGDVTSRRMTASEDTAQAETTIRGGRRFLLSTTDRDRTSHVALRVSADSNRVRILAVGFEARLIDPPWDSWPEHWVEWILSER